MGDPAVSELVEVVDDQVHRAGVVGPDGGESAAPTAGPRAAVRSLHRADGDGGEPEDGEGLGAGVADPGVDDDDAVDAALGPPAAIVDGANVWQRFVKVALPAVKGTLAVVAIFAFMGAWDDFLWPLIVLSDSDNFTLTVGLNFLHGTFANNQRVVAAGTIIAVAPLIVMFACLQRFFFRGVGEGAVKG